jgi:hypothetical protein
MSYIGSTPTSQNFISGTDYFNGTGAQTVFTLTRSVNSVNDVEVIVNNVIQQPNSYTVSGTTLTLSAAPSSGSSNIYVRYLSTNMQSFVVGNNTVGYNQLTADMQSKFAMKNRLINGDFRIDQRNAGASVTPGNGVYTLDRWCNYQNPTGKYSIQQNAGSVTPPAGFSNYLGVTSLSSYTVGSGEYFILQQQVEGYNFADMNWGTANAKTITLSFWVRSSLTGQFGGSLVNGSDNYSYPFAYTISAANTWEQKTITIVGPTAGTWVGATNGTGVKVHFSLGVASALMTTPSTWTSGNYISATGSTSVVGTNGATWFVTGVQLEVGSSATGFEYRQYGQELALCQRYYQTSGGILANYTAFHYGGSAYTSVILPVTMRASPSVAYTGIGSTYYEQSTTYSFTVASFAANNPQSLTFQINVSGGTSGYCGTFYPIYQASAEL